MFEPEPVGCRLKGREGPIRPARPPCRMWSNILKQTHEGKKEAREWEIRVSGITRENLFGLTRENLARLPGENASRIPSRRASLSRSVLKMGRKRVPNLAQSLPHSLTPNQLPSQPPSPPGNSLPRLNRTSGIELFRPPASRHRQHTNCLLADSCLSLDEFTCFTIQIKYIVVEY